MRLLLAALALSVAPVLAAPGPAAALSCVGPEAVLRDAPSIISGRILEWDEERVSIEVAEVWKGESVPAHVEYDVELAGWWQMDGLVPPRGKTVFAPRDGALSPCTVFPLRGFYADEVRAFRPEEPAAPASVTSDAQTGTAMADRDQAAGAGLGPRALLAGAGLVLVVSALGAWVWRRRRL